MPQEIKFKESNSSSSEMYFNLEEAIACPPALNSDGSLKSRENNNGVVDVLEASDHCKRSSASRCRKDVLSCWCERPSIQEFMNAVLSLSVMKQQQLQQQQKLHDMIRQKVQQQLQEQQLKQKQEQLQQQKQQIQLQKQINQQLQAQQNLVKSDRSFGDSLQKSLVNKTESLLTDGPLIFSQSQNRGAVNIQENCQRRQKVKKVMKGGVLVTMPGPPRQQTGVKSLEHINTQEEINVPSENYKEKAVDYCGGNILDDILARTKQNKQGNVNDAITKIPKTMLKLTSTENVESTCDVLSENVSSNKNKIEVCEKSENFTGSEESRVLEHCSANTGTRTISGNTVTGSLQTKPFCGVVRGMKTDSVAESINVSSLAVCSATEKEGNISNKDSSFNSLSKEKPQIFETLKGNAMDGKIALTKPCAKPAESKVGNTGSASLANISPYKENKSIFENEEVTTHETATTRSLSELSQMNTGLQITCTSDTESASSGAMVIDLSPGQDSEYKSCKKYFGRARNESFTSESSDDVHMQPCFDRIRALQLNTTNKVFTGATDEGVKPLQGIPRAYAGDGDEGGKQKDLNPEVDMNVIKDINKNKLTESAETSKTLSLNGNIDIADGNCKDLTENFTKSMSLKQEQWISENHLDKFLTGIQTSTWKPAVSQISTTTQSGFSSGQFPEMSMEIHEQSPETPKTEEKTVNSKENERKRKELVCGTALIETKRKRPKRKRKTNHAVCTGQKKREMNIRSSIKTKRKKTGKKNRSSKLQIEYEGRITRSMSQSHGTKLPQNAKTQEGTKAKGSPTNKEATFTTEKLDIAPTLLSMVSGEAIDITVACESRSNSGVRKNKRGGVKKKKNKITEWFKRQQKLERENLKRDQKTLERKINVCPYYLRGQCTKGAKCKFKHERIQALCGRYAAGKCCRFQDGLCPYLHSEFPCKYFHKKRFCWNGNNCRFSHQPLTEETWKMLDEYLLALEQKKDGGVDISSSAEVQADTNTSVNDKNETIVHNKVTERDPTKNNDGGLKTAKENTIEPAKPAMDDSPASVADRLHSTARFKRPLPALSSSKPAEPRRVKRLCSLSSYKPQILPSFVSSLIKSPENSASKPPTESRTTDSLKTNADETQRSHTKFLPGMFKER